MSDTTITAKLEFEALAKQLEREVTELIRENIALKKELAALKAKQLQPDMFSNIPDNQKAALRQQIQAMITKIDAHLGEHA